MFWRVDWDARRDGDFIPMNNDWKTILFEQEEELGILTINRGRKLNALNKKVLEELRDCLEQLIQQKQNIRGLILVGDGEKAFIAGADIKAMSEMTREEANDFGELGQKVTTLFEDLPFPIIACVHGFALGGGMEMAMSCDFILTTKDSVFGQPEVKLGLIPGFGGTQRLTRIVGKNRASELIYTGRNIKADEALEIGLVIKVLADKKSLMKEARKILKTIFQNSPRSIALAKGAIHEGADQPLKKGLECELEFFSSIFGSPDMLEGTKAFLEKRTPKFGDNH